MSVATAKPASQGARVLSYAGALLETMDSALASHANVFIMGQGVDDFKGIFGSTTGLAEKYGAAFCINARQEDAVKRVREITQRGSDVVVEAAGTVRTVEQTPFMVRKAGRVVLVGEFKGYLNLEDADEALFFTSYISPVEYPMAVQLIAEKSVDVKGLITHRFKLADFEKALQTADNAAEKPVKIVITA